MITLDHKWGILREPKYELKIIEKPLNKQPQQVLFSPLHMIIYSRQQIHYQLHVFLYLK